MQEANESDLQAGREGARRVNEEGLYALWYAIVDDGFCARLRDRVSRIRDSRMSRQ